MILSYVKRFTLLAPTAREGGNRQFMHPLEVCELEIEIFVE
jgi:hypothetical protein